MPVSETLDQLRAALWIRFESTITTRLCLRFGAVEVSHSFRVLTWQVRDGGRRNKVSYKDDQCDNNPPFIVLGFIGSE